MKKKSLYIIIIVLIFCLVGYGLYSTRINKSYGESSMFSKRDIKSAMAEVEKYFNKHYKNCKLTDLWYDEEKAIVFDSTIDYSKGTTIILFSNFDTKDDSNPTLNPNSKYFNYGWVLTRQTATSDWEVTGAGY